jgi:hypothetical protein
MDENRQSVWKRVMKRLFKAFVIVAVLSAVVYGGLSVMATRREKAVRAKWAQAGRPLETFVATIPETKPNATAEALEDAANRLGLERAKKKEPWTAIALPLTDYLNSELEKDGPPVSAPPEVLAAFLRDQAPLITKARTALLEGPPPVWVERNKRLYESPLPNLLQIISLEKILAADALAALSRGDREAAMADLEAGWRLGDALGARPELISSLVTIGSLRYPVAVLRRVDGAGPAWRARLVAYSPRDCVARSYEFETAAMLELGDMGSSGGPPTLLRRVGDLLGRPYLRLSFAGAADTVLEMVRIAEAAGPCPEGLGPKMVEAIGAIPKWNVLAKIAVPNINPSWGRAYRFQLDLELTEKILILKEARDKNGGAWPEAVPDIESSACPNGAWSYTRSPDRVTLVYNRTPKFPDVKSTALVLPLRYEEVVTAPR